MNNVSTIKVTTPTKADPVKASCPPVKFKTADPQSPGPASTRYAAKSAKSARSTKAIRPLVFAVTIALSAAAAMAGAPDAKTLSKFWAGVFTRPIDAIPIKVFQPSPRQLLGQQLFTDPRLSGNEDRACMSCHDPDRGFTDGNQRAVGLDAHPLERNVPTLFNVAWGKSFNWDGSAQSLEEQALGPLQHKQEMAGAFPQIVERLRADTQMRSQFATAFRENPVISKHNILSALATYERSIVSPKTRFDQWIDGNEAALSVAEKDGFVIFKGKGGCIACHVGWRFTDDGFHDIGLPNERNNIAADVAGKKGVMAFKTPTLRALKLTAPYMHDGSLENLNAVIDHYTKGIRHRKGLANHLERKIKLTAKEKANLIAFLKTL